MEDLVKAPDNSVEVVEPEAPLLKEMFVESDLPHLPFRQLVNQVLQNINLTDVVSKVENGTEYVVKVPLKFKKAYAEGKVFVVQNSDTGILRPMLAKWNDDGKKLFPITPAETKIDFSDPRYKEYKVTEPKNATYKLVNYYELLGERVNADSFAGMVRSVAAKLFDMDSSVIERMAKNNEVFPGWINPVFSYDENAVKEARDLRKGSGIYISSGYSAYDCICFIRELLKEYDLDIEEDFVYSARSYKTQADEEV